MEELKIGKSSDKSRRGRVSRNCDLGEAGRAPLFSPGKSLLWLIPQTCRKKRKPREEG